MTAQSSGDEMGRMVVGYFSDGADAYRAIHELIDEGFEAGEIGAAFRTRRVGIATPEEEDLRRPKGTLERNPALTGSVGGAGSQDQAVTPAGLAPGSGAAFPAVGAKGPIPGAETPSTLPHDLPSTLPSQMESGPSVAREPGALASGSSASAVHANQSPWMDRLRRAYEPGYSGQEAASTDRSNRSSQRFGTGEGRLDLYPVHDYSEPAFEGSFLGMGVGSTEARNLSSELSRGGAVVSVRTGSRSSLAEAILERNHGHIRIGAGASGGRPIDRESPVEVYGAMCNYYQPEEGLRRKAS